MSELNRSRHAQGENNLRFLGFDVHGPVFFASAALLLAILAWVIAYPAAATEFFAEALALVTTRAGGLMGALGNLFVLFCLFLIVSPYGSVRLGGPQAKPEFSNLSWFAMLFAAGMGIGLVFYSVAEPLSHFSSSMAATTAETAAAAPLGGAPDDAQASARTRAGTSGRPPSSRLQTCRTSRRLRSS
jgi:BCCT family betaine/carnitine transporter